PRDARRSAARCAAHGAARLDRPAHPGAGRERRAVGGDAILITDAGAGRARHVLIDGGEHGATIVAGLTRLNVDTLAAVILSHPHADHYGGLGAVVTRFPVRAFVYGGTPRTAVTYRALLRAIDSLRIPVVTADTGV